jgi:hypothetical protein
MCESCIYQWIWFHPCLCKLEHALVMLYSMRMQPCRIDESSTYLLTFSRCLTELLKRAPKVELDFVKAPRAVLPELTVPRQECHRLCAYRQPYASRGRERCARTCAMR